MMEERILAKGNKLKYNEIHRNFRRIREAKNTWLREQCENSKKLHENHEFSLPQITKRDIKQIV